ncbi:MAG: peptidase M23 [Chryseobacterium sp. 36-9]|jgi:murein DD-endopeptidase MepM/ murein hydrolase activator NlpD|uniref:Murein DD-endopeptidase MepM and murein hydrolase activator NlpD, contain LysM domain n=1 Tax=Epilithonimonas pallida TaxID=373671 RepID=A0ABY1R2Z1_9FLAO|nr:M23 family metallopeptidase [Epilithonimonas pallida]OJX32081.1 MAG: peptidase M23 [Chryseobacterium sp. 36-9]SMP91496.1 Murein DD-endopeptidase MepM and murein hydrolase activator NlpD, contain LysM domain [Epilithonimonas pallida]
MVQFLKSKKKTNIVLILLLVACFVQAMIIAKLYTGKDDKVYEVNLVKINNEKDSIDHLQLKTDLAIVDQSIRSIDGFLKSKNVSDLRIERLAKDSLENEVYLAKVSNRYSQYLVDLEQRLQQVPLGIPTDGYISSNFGIRKNPIPPKSTEITNNSNVAEEKDSLGNVVKRQAIVKEDKNASSNAPAEKDQMQFHKGLDIAVAYGSPVKCAASGKVIFAGVKGGYGNCVIIEHSNGLATLYGHLSEVLVETNDRVKVGQIIAKSGNTGRSTGPHLHYEVHKNNQPINPRLFLNF